MRKRVIAAILSAALLFTDSWIVYAVESEKVNVEQGAMTIRQEEESAADKEQRTEEPLPEAGSEPEDTAKKTVSKPEEEEKVVPEDEPEAKGSAKSMEAVSDDFQYTADGGVAVITKYTGTGGNVVIPSELDGFTVTKIGPTAFRDLKTVTAVDIADTVTNIDAGAFANCSELSQVELPAELAEMSAHAFYNCDKLTEIFIPKSLTTTNNAYIYEYARGYVDGPFYGCDSLKRVSFETGITTIAKGLFANCPGIEEIVIPDTVTTIGNAAFTADENLSGVTFGANITEIGDGAFSKCGRLTDVNMNDKVKKLGSAAFAQCGELKEVHFSRVLEEMSAHAFYDCDKLTAVEIPASLVKTTNAYIYEYAYGYVYGPFYNCDGLKNITFENGTTTIANGLFANCPGIEKVVIPDTVTSVGNDAFYQAAGLTQITFGANIAEVGGSAFAKCGRLTAVNMNDKIKKIGAGAFAKCTELSAVHLSRVLEEMSAHVFYDCDKLTAVEIPASLIKTTDAYINEYAYGYVYGPFYNCDGLKNVTFESGATTIANGLFANCPGIEKIVIPDTVKVIGSGAFPRAVNLSEVTFGENVTEIGDNAFEKCPKLTEIDMKDHVTRIGAAAFAKCTALRKVRLSRELESMGAHAFYDCDGITSIEIPKSLKTTTDAYIYEYDHGYTWGPFYNCDGLKNITFEKGATKIVTGLFAHCPSLTGMVVPDQITEIQGRAFEGCHNLTALELTNNVEKFDLSAINGCENVSLFCNYGSPVHIMSIEEQIPVKLMSYAYDDYSDLGIENDCSYRVDYNSLSINGYAKITVHYNIKEEVFDQAKETAMNFFVPQNSDFYEEEIRVNGERSYDHVIDDRKLTIALTEPEGDITIGFSPETVEDLSTAAVFQYELDNRTEKELIGFDNSSRSVLTIGTDEVTSLSEITVQGLGNSSAAIDLYIDDTFQKTVTAAKTGKYKAELTLPDPADGKSYTVEARNPDDKDQTAEVRVQYNMSTPVMTEFKLYYNNHSDAVIDLMASESKPYIAFNPKVPFTFVADFDNTEELEDVYIVSTRNNERKIMEAEYDGSTGKYIASGYFDEDDHNYVPGNLTVEYRMKHEETKVGQDVDWDAMYNALPKELRNTEITEIEDENGEIKYRMDLSGVAEEFTGVIIDLTVSEIGEMTGVDINEWLGGYEDILNACGVFVPGLDGDNYFVSLWNEDPANAILVVSKNGLNLAEGAVKIQMDFSLTENFEMEELAGKLGNYATAVSAAGDIWNFYKDRNELINEIYQSPGIANKTEAVQKADALFRDQMQYTIMVALLPVFVSAIGITGPVSIAFTGLLAMIGITSSFFWDARTNNIKGGEFGIRWGIDPSGYVYEAVESNRLEGVKVTAYYKENLEDPQGILWDASEYEQVNPLYTDEEGRYSWDVPEGYWQVKYEKEGYETTYSDWLPVPPPQTEVNIGMVSKEKPVVESVTVYADHAEVVFSKYMVPDSAAGMKLTDKNGKNIPYVLEYDKDLVSPEGVNYAKEFTMRFAEGTLLQSGDSCVFSIDGSAKSYAGTAADPVEKSVSVNKTIEIAVPEKVTVKMGDSVEIPVQLINAPEGQEFTALSDADDIAYVTNVTGNGFKVTGSMYGEADITISLSDKNVKKTIHVTVGQKTEEAEVTPVVLLAQKIYTLNAGSSVTITPEVYPDTVSSAGSWSIVSGDGVVTISGNTVKAVRGGEAVLRYTLAGLEDTYAECRIIVETSIKRGDVDGSGNVDIADLRMVLRAVCKKITLTETQKQSADVTDDGSVGIEDLRKILRYVCRKIDEL